MTSERDLPCAARGGELEEAMVDPLEAGASVTTTDSTVVTVCQSSGERYYPEQTLRTLDQSSTPESTSE